MATNPTQKLVPFLDPQYGIGLEVEVRGFETGGEWKSAQIVSFQDGCYTADLKERDGHYSSVFVTDPSNNIRRIR
jgi:hypothetical protein